MSSKTVSSYSLPDLLYGFTRPFVHLWHLSGAQNRISLDSSTTCCATSQSMLFPESPLVYVLHIFFHFSLFTFGWYNHLGWCSPGAHILLSVLLGSVCVLPKAEGPGINWRQGETPRCSQTLMPPWHLSAGVYLASQLLDVVLWSLKGNWLLGQSKKGWTCETLPLHSQGRLIPVEPCLTPHPQLGWNTGRHSHLCTGR